MFSFGSGLAIEFQHRGAEVDDRHLGSRRSVEAALSAPARGQAEHVPAPDIAAEPADAIDVPQRITQFFIGDNSAQRRIVRCHLLVTFSVGP